MSENPLHRRLAAFALVAMLIAISVFMVFSPRVEGLPEGDLPAFESEAQLRKFLASHRTWGWDDIGLGDEAGENAIQHSSTNVQVEGVDEIDMVKNDGSHLYVGSADKVTIIEVSPHGDMQVVSTINAAELVSGEDSYSSMIGLFLWEDILAVVICEYRWNALPAMGILMDAVYPSDRAVTACVLLDVSDAGEPQVMYRCSMSGWFTAGRSIDDRIYLLTQENIWEGDDLSLPLIEKQGRTEKVEATDIRFDPQATEQNAFLNIMALDMGDRSSNFTTLVMGYSSVLYVSMQNMYLTNVVYPEDEAEASQMTVPATNIVRLRLDGTSVVPEAKGQVPGYLHNQFSMDEHEGMLRVATCTAWMDGENRVYVLDDELRAIGSLEGIAPGETIQSARFLDDTLYLVTFLNTDPLFVIDLSDPISPRLLGELIVPGFSSYLHPIGDKMLAGVGLDNWTFKVSLYDVSAPASIRELETLMAPSYSWSEANWDHKAVLFDAMRSWMFVPYTAYDQISYECDQVVWVIAMGEGGLTTMAELETCSWSMFVRCVLIGDAMLVVTDSETTSYIVDGFLEVGKVAYGGDEVIRGEDAIVGQVVER
jgi:inhibitor of cysteine peptidase